MCLCGADRERRRGTPSAVYRPGHHQRQDRQRATDAQPPSFHHPLKALRRRRSQSQLREWHL